MVCIGHELPMIDQSHVHCTGYNLPLIDQKNNQMDIQFIRIEGLKGPCQWEAHLAVEHH